MMIDSHAESTPQADASHDRSVSDALAETLVSAGCRRAFGILGGAAVPLFSSLVEHGLDPIHVRHEAGAAFMALEHELAGGGPGLIFTTTGPGLTNVLTGIAAARADGGRVVLLSALTGAPFRGAHAFQASDTQSLANRGLYGPGGWFDAAVTLDSPEQLPRLRAMLLEGLRRKQGFVAHIAVPLGVQTAPARSLGPTPRYVDDVSSTVTAEQVARALGRRVAVWVGHGARNAAPQVRALVDRLDARVMSSPRGKGIFPAHDSRFLGVTGFGGHDHVPERRSRFRPDTTLVLGSRLGEFTSFWDPRLVEGTRLIHVDTDASVFGAAYPDVETLGVRAEIGSLLDGLLDTLPPDPRLARRVRSAHAPRRTCEPAGRACRAAR